MAILGRRRREDAMTREELRLNHIRVEVMALREPEIARKELVDG
jgi:hypothetical protein